MTACFPGNPQIAGIPCSNAMLRLRDKSLLAFSPAYRRRNKLAVPYDLRLFLDTLMRPALGADSGMPSVSRVVCQACSCKTRWHDLHSSKQRGFIKVALREASGSSQSVLSGNSWRRTRNRRNAQMGRRVGVSVVDMP
jgi:hypothetical protein